MLWKGASRRGIVIFSHVGFPAFRKAVLVQPCYGQLGTLFLYSKGGEAELPAELKK